MQEIMIKTHLITTNITDEYYINWCGKILDTKPKFKNNKPIFVCVGSRCRIEINTTDMKRVEDIAKKCTQPKGKNKITTDTARIYIIQEDNNEKLLGVLTHDRVKTFAPMYDAVGFRDD